jgi:hypothetical protein
MTTWTNLSSDPSSDERVLRDAQKTIEKVVEAARVALDDELALQQMEYDQVYGLNSMQFAMYQTLVMTFFQDHQMLASLNLKRSRPDLSPGINESKRAALMEVIAQRVSSGTPALQQPIAQHQQQQQQMQELQGASPAWQSGASQPPPPPAWGPPPSSPAAPNNANWLEQPSPAKAESSAGDWLNSPGSSDRPQPTAWPKSPDSGQDAANWTLKPGSGQIPIPPANSDNGSSWNSGSSNGWPTEAPAKTSETGWPTQPAPAAKKEAESAWPTAAAAQAAWPEPPANSKQLPPAAWPAANSGSPPKQVEPLPTTAPQSDVVRPAWSAPIGESGQSGTWSLDPNNRPGGPPAPAWSSQNSDPAASWNTQQRPAQPPQPAWQQGAEAQQPSPQPPQPPQVHTQQGAWNTNPGGSPQPAWSPEQANPVQSNQQQPWQAPAPGNGANPSQPWQPGSPAPASTAPPPAWQNTSQTPVQPQQSWQGPNEPTPQPQSAPQPAWQTQQPAPNQTWQPGMPAQPAAGAQPWTPPTAPTMPMPGVGAPQPGSNGSHPQPAWQPPGQGIAPPVMAQSQPQPQQAFQNQAPQYPGTQDFQNPAMQNQQMQYPPPGQGQLPQQGYQMPQQVTSNTEDMSISFDQQGNQQGQNGATLGGVLRQMRNFDPTRKRNDDDDRPKEQYNPNNAW